MEYEFAMRDELYNSDFCFPESYLLSFNNNIDITKKYYGFDCGVGSFCCFANKENIYKILNVAKKYDCQDLFLNKYFNKNSLLKFKSKTIDELRKNDNSNYKFPVIFWFKRSYAIDDIRLKDYLDF